MTAFRVLLADDDSLSRDFLAEALGALGCEVTAVDDGESAVSRLEHETYDFVVSDLRMPRLDGFGVLDHLRSLDSRIAFVLVTAYGSSDVAVEALRRGADDVIFKPVAIEDLQTSIARLEKRALLLAENALLRKQSDSSMDVVIVSPASRSVWDVVDRVASTPATVLVLGESGTGKEVVASALHTRSSRRDGPFIRVNCAALPESLIESEIFGHEAGAFTGASARKLGRFELADQGTLFLDEIGELPLPLQAKLLRVLETGTFMRVGGVDAITVDVRLVAATNARLDEMVRDGRFREDLYYRLNIIPIELPALRDRRDDILPLADRFLEVEARRLARSLPVLDNEARALLYAYDWPGNVRELRNLIQRAVVLASGSRISRESIEAWLRGAVLTPDRTAPERCISPPAAHEEQRPDSVSLAIGQTLREVEDAFILATLESVDGKRSDAARMLGIAPRTLYNRLRVLADR